MHSDTNIGALIITYTMVGVPYYSDSYLLPFSPEAATWAKAPSTQCGILDTLKTLKPKPQTRTDHPAGEASRVNVFASGESSEEEVQAATLLLWRLVPRVIARGDVHILERFLCLNARLQRTQKGSECSTGQHTTRKDPTQGALQSPGLVFVPLASFSVRTLC